MSIIIVKGNPNSYQILILFTRQLNQSNLLLTLSYVHEVQFISSCALNLPLMTSFVN